MTTPTFSPQSALQTAYAQCERFRPGLFSLFLQRFQDYDLAGDLTQTCLLRLYTGLERGSITPPVGWALLRKSAEWIIREYHKSRPRQASLLSLDDPIRDDLSEDGREIPDWRYEPLAVLLQREVQAEQQEIIDSARGEWYAKNQAAVEDRMLRIARTLTAEAAKARSDQYWARQEQTYRGEAAKARKARYRERQRTLRSQANA